jgi:hypothetical protein
MQKPRLLQPYSPSVISESLWKDIMEACWRDSPSDRPPISYVVKSIESACLVTPLDNKAMVGNIINSGVP